MVFVLTLPTVFLAHLLLRHADYSFSEGLLAGVIAMVVAGVLMRYFSSPTGTLPVIELAFVQYYAFWVFPIFIPGGSTRSAPFEVLQESGAVDWALLAALVFMAALGIGVAGTKWSLRIPRLRRFGRPISTSLLISYAALTLWVTWSYWVGSSIERGLEGSRPWYYFTARVFASPYLAQILIAYELIRYPSRRFLRLAYGLFVIALITICLIDSRLYWAFMVILIMVLSSIVTSKNKIPKLRYILLAILLLLTFNPAKVIYRRVLREDNTARNSITARIEAWADALYLAWKEEGGHGQDPFEKTGRRFDDLSTIATVIHLVPEEVDYEMGSTWAAVVHSFIPSAVWPNKPSLVHTTHDHFNITFGFLSESEVSTTTGRFPILAEGYWNFGWVGILINGLLSGIFFVAIRNFFSITDRIRFAVPFVILADFPAYRAMGGLFGGLPQIIVGTLIVILLLEAHSILARKARRSVDSP